MKKTDEFLDELNDKIVDDINETEDTENVEEAETLTEDEVLYEGNFASQKEIEAEKRKAAALTKSEQEVNVNFSMDDQKATMYVSSTKWLKKMDEMAKKYPNDFEIIDVGKIAGTVVSKTYRFDSKYFKIGKPRAELSEERKEELRGRLKNFNKPKDDEDEE